MAKFLKKSQKENIYILVVTNSMVKGILILLDYRIKTNEMIKHG